METQQQTARPGKVFKIKIKSDNSHLTYICISFNRDNSGNINFYDKYDEYKEFSKESIYSIEEVNDIQKLNPGGKNGNR